MEKRNEALQATKMLAPLQLGTSSSMPRLRNCDEWLQPLGVYPSTMYRLSNSQRIRWLSRQKLQPVECDDSQHNIAIEEEPEAPTSPKQAATGKESIARFYAQYKDLTKSTSPARCKAKAKTNSAAIVYLQALDRLHQLPKPMGIAKWRGPPSELDLA